MALRRRGRRGRSGPLIVTYQPRSDRDAVHVGYAVGRAVGNAVTRNRVRRRLREALRHLDRRGVVAGPGDLLVSARPEAAVMGYDGLVAHLGAALAELTGGSRR